MTQPAAPIRPEPRRWVQFSLKSLMLLILMVAAGLSGWSMALRKAREVEALSRREAEMARNAEMQARELAQEQAYQSQLLFLLAQVRQHGTDPMPPVKDQDVADSIEAVLRLQAEAWNAGQIDRFMEHYWKSEELTFSASGQTTRGWQNTLDRYRQRYPTVEKMGRLTFDHLEIQLLGDTAALVLGQWHLARETDSLDGNFSLIVRNMDGRWLIVHDHTSRTEKPAPPPTDQ
jgi:ketosteroid isomerase-like protein